MTTQKFDFYEIGVRKNAERITEISELIRRFVDEYPVKIALFKEGGDLYGNGKYSCERTVSKYLRNPSDKSLIFVNKDCHWNNAILHGYWKVEAYDLTCLEEKGMSAEEITRRMKSREDKILMEPDYIRPLFRVSASIDPYHEAEIGGREDSGQVLSRAGYFGGLLEVHEARRLIDMLPEGEFEENLIGEQK